MAWWKGSTVRGAAKGEVRALGVRNERTQLEESFLRVHRTREYPENRSPLPPVGVSKIHAAVLACGCGGQAAAQLGAEHYMALEGTAPVISLASLMRILGVHSSSVM